MSLVRLGSIFGGNGFDLWDTFSIFRSAVAVGSEATSFANTRIECRETPEAFVFCADLPGVKKEEVKVEVEEDGNVLVIAGERSRERVERSDTLHQIERASGAFLGRFHLPESARVDQVRAALDANGVLTVTVPKEGVKKPEAKDIEFCA